MTEESAPCYAHLLVDGQPVDPQTRRDVARFRRAERARLMATRRALSVAEGAAQSARVTERLEGLIRPTRGAVIAAYWPIRGELDLRGWMRAMHAKGARIALPVVVENAAPVQFHRWTPGAEMKRGVWNIPVPAAPEPLSPKVVVAPLLGLDARGYRLGNGGGYYDRTLAALSPPPRIIGVGHDFCRIETIFPMPWDVPMMQSVLGCGTVLDHAARD